MAGFPDSGGCHDGRKQRHQNRRTETVRQDVRISQYFDQYAYVAVIAPGAALLFGLLLVWPGIFPDGASSETSLGALGVFLIAACIAGQILRAIGDVAERTILEALRRNAVGMGALR
jgi:hypothetical protein